jgi:hypothetical protein
VFSYNNSFSNNEISRNTKSYKNLPSKNSKCLDDPARGCKFREKDSSDNSINLTNNKENHFNGNGIINLSETDKNRKLENFVGSQGREDIEELMLKNLLEENSEQKTWGPRREPGAKAEGKIVRSP